MPDNTIRGRFAPSPSGRLHLGNVLTFLLVIVSVFYFKSLRQQSGV